MPNLSSLTSQQRSALRAAAHALRPVVLIGDHGLTDAVLKEIDRALAVHGLIKVRAGGEDRASREALLADICAALSCHPVHHLGKVLILYRPTDADAAIQAGVASASPARRKASEPHTPKKLAAEGKTLSKSAARPAARRKPASVPANSELLNKRPAVRPGTTGKPAAPARQNAARRAGSALSLRAGVRNGGLTRTVGARKTPTKTPRSR